MTLFVYFLRIFAYDPYSLGATCQRCCPPAPLPIYNVFSLWQWILTRNYKALTKGVKGSCSSFINIVMELKKCCNHPFLVRTEEEQDVARGREERLTQLVKASGKLMLLDKLLVRLKDTGHRVLIFSQMVRMLDILAEYLTLRSWSFQRLDGTTRGDQRKQAMDHFNAKKSVDFCFLLSTRAGGLGVNLATADTVIIFDSDWNPQNDLQAQARAHRIGQTRQVSVYRLVHKSSVEEDIIERAKKKMVLDHLVIQRMDTTGRTILNKRFGQEGTKSSNPFNKEELSQILKFGAQELFGEADGDEEEPEVDVDDILRMAETRQTEEEEVCGAAADLLSQFKVVTFDNLEDEEIVIRNEGRQRKTAVASGAAVRGATNTAANEDASSWDNIIPEETRKRLEQEEAEQRLMELELGPRQRKTVQPLNYGCEDKEKEERSDEDSLSSDDGGGGNRRGRGRGLNSRAAGSDPRTRGFTDKEIRALVRALRKFAAPLERLEDVATDAELQEKSSSDLRALIEVILSGCREAATAVPATGGTNSGDHEDSCTSEAAAAVPSKRKAAVFQLGRVSVPVKAVLQTAQDLAPLHKALGHLGREERRNFKVPFHTKPAVWDCVWDEVDDSALLIGLWEHGMDNWEAIKEDPDLGLRSKIMREGFLKPQATHLKTRAEYLLKLMARKGGDERTGNVGSSSKSARAKKLTTARRDATSHNLVGSSSGVLAPKSKEFISSDSSDSSDTGISNVSTKKPTNSSTMGSTYSSKKTTAAGASRGTKRAATIDMSTDVKRKRASHKTSATASHSHAGDSSEAATKPVHLTAERQHDTVSHDKTTGSVGGAAGNENEDSTTDLDKLSSAVFNECKEKLRTVRKALKKLQETSSGDVDAMSDHLLKIGDHISSLIRESPSKEEQRVWRNNLWIFVSYFTECDKTQLHKLYKRTYKKREEESKGSSKRRHATSESVDEHSHNHRRHHYHRSQQGTSKDKDHKKEKDVAEHGGKKIDNHERWSGASTPIKSKSINQAHAPHSHQQQRSFGHSHNRDESSANMGSHISQRGGSNCGASTYLEYQRQIHGGDWRQERDRSHHAMGAGGTGNTLSSSRSSNGGGGGGNTTSNRYNNSYNRRGGGATSWSNHNRFYSGQYTSSGSSSGTKYGGNRGGGGTGY